MFSPLKRQKRQCSELWELLEIKGDGTTVQDILAEVTPEQRAHVENCDDCRKKVEELATARALLSVRKGQTDVSGAWFASRVMAAIAAREAESSRTISAWTVVPKLASRLVWVLAVAILVAGSLLYQKPRPSQRGTDPSQESLFDYAPAPASHDDILASLVENER